MQNLTNHQIDITSIPGYVVSGTTVIMGLTLDEIDLLARIIGVAVGVIVGIGTLWMTWHFKSLNYKLNAREIKHRKPRKKGEERRDVTK